MKLVYIANARIPTEKAHGIQIIKMCEAFSQAGAEVELVVPRRFNKIKDDPFDYYGVEKIFRITKIPSIDLVKFGKIGFWLQSCSFAKFAFFYILFRKADIIYSRDALPLFFLNFSGRDIFWESHDGQLNFVVKRILKKCKKLVVITQALKDFYVEKGVEADKILVAPDGVDLKEFDIVVSQREARQKFNLPKNKKIVLYSGSFYLYDWKGVDVLLDAVKYLPDDYLVVLVGGEKDEIEKIKKEYAGDKLLLAGRKAHGEIPYYLKAADVLVLPNSAKEDISKFYTSPLKLFEYMASGRPIVASGLPSIKEVLNQNNAFLVEPDNPQKLAEGIEKALRDHDLADRISRQAYLDVQNYTWTKRAENILNFIKSDKN